MKLISLLLALLAFHNLIYAGQVVSAKTGDLSDTFRYFLYIADSKDGPYVQFRMVNVSTTSLERFWEEYPQFLLQLDGPGEQQRADQKRQCFSNFNLTER